MIDSPKLDAKIWVLGEAYYSTNCDYLLCHTCSIQTTLKGRRRTF
nr:hypothetical protein [uncultured Campylobacter sp.]